MADRMDQSSHADRDDREEVYACDRTGWPAGPWDGEPDKLQFRTAAGLPGLIVRNRSGSLCGYAAVAKGHPLYGVDYALVSEGIDIRIHGGLTYSDRCRDGICHVPEPGEPDDVWWLGFDCGHAGDVSPRMLLLGFHGLLSNESYKDIAYVRAEVESLAAQLQEIGR